MSRTRADPGEQVETVERTLEVAGMPSVRTVNVTGDTRISRGAEGRVVVRARKRVTGFPADRAKRMLDSFEIRIERNGDAITVQPHLHQHDRSWQDLFRDGGVVDLELEVPQEASLDVQATSGSISFREVRGPVTVQNVSGLVSLVDVRGPLRLSTVSGSVDCDRYAGRCECTSVSGDIGFRSSCLRAADVQTVSGTVAIDGDLIGAASHRIRTISGDVQLGLAGSSYEVEFQSMSGDLESRRDSRIAREGRHHRLMVIGDGAVKVHVKTTSGDLRLAPPSSPPASGDAAPAAPQTEQPDERTILERVARGELGVDDAQRLLHAGAAAPADEARRATADAAAGEGSAGGARGRTLRIRVTADGAQKVNVAIPLAIARVGGKVKLAGLVRGHLGKLGIDLEEVLRELERTGRIVDVTEGGDRVEIFVE